MSETCNRLPRWLELMRQRFPRFTARYVTFDARSLGLLRIYLGLLLLTDLLRRVPYLRTFYTNEGLLPNHMLLWRPRAEFPFSFFFLASLPHEAVLLFVLCGGVFLMLLVGYRTRLFQVLSLICICSLHNRLILFDYGSETTTRLLTFWTVFLPLGARFSFDAVRASVAGDPAREPRAMSTSVVSLAVTASLLQLSLIYVFNALHKDGGAWRDGSAVHYVLQQDRIVTWLGWQLRHYLTLPESRILTFTALAIETLLPLLILSPIAQRYTRRLAIALGIGLHLGFALLLNLGLFSFNMIGFFLLLLSDSDWQALRGAFESRPRLRRGWAAIERASTELCVRVARALDGPPPVRRPARGPWPRAWSERAPFVREATVLLFVYALGSEMSHANRAVPAWMHLSRPTFTRMLVAYPRLYQGWSMFAPDAPFGDMHVFVDALTVDGRHVDPINQIASRVADPNLHEIPERLGQDDEFCDYLANIVDAPEYHGALTDWIFAYSQRTGRDRDRIVSFRVWVLRDQSPKPGEKRPHNVRRTQLFQAHR